AEGSMKTGDLPKKRRWLLDQMPVGGTCAEIGVWQGDFSHWILEITRPRSLHLIDPWGFSLAERDRATWHGGAAARGQEDMDRIYEGVASRFAGEIAGGLVTIHRSPSSEAVVEFPDGYFAWIYVDGDHFYDAVRRDLELWKPKLRQGGIIAGDDYRESPVYGTDVIRAVDEFAIAHGLTVESKGRQYLMRLPH
ncbi:MAG: class I SAM-dependent methyltransferase, partial [Thermomicrobiales bacterium]